MNKRLHSRDLQQHSDDRLCISVHVCNCVFIPRDECTYTFMHKDYHFRATFHICDKGAHYQPWLDVGGGSASFNYSRLFPTLPKKKQPHSRCLGLIYSRLTCFSAFSLAIIYLSTVHWVKTRPDVWINKKMLSLAPQNEEIIKKYSLEMHDLHFKDLILLKQSISMCFRPNNCIYSLAPRV